jgi:bifunctional DNA-binding transcriptional regulator/antitoxin component of YhaV-PrlF toxin-antitoxin module
MRIRLTAKRQATLPRRVCEELGVRPGDALLLDSRVVGGERVWLLKVGREVDVPWFGRFAAYAQGKPHDRASIRKSVEKARRRERA